jgi:hypothetical protein
MTLLEELKALYQQLPKEDKLAIKETLHAVQTDQDFSLVGCEEEFEVGIQ